MISSGTNVWCRVMHTYLSMAAAIRKPVCFSVVRGQIGAAAAERDPQRAARNDHIAFLNSGL